MSQWAQSQREIRYRNLIDKYRELLKAVLESPTHSISIQGIKDEAHIHPKPGLIEKITEALGEKP